MGLSPLISSRAAQLLILSSQSRCTVSSTQRLFWLIRPALLHSLLSNCVPGTHTGLSALTPPTEYSSTQQPNLLCCWSVVDASCTDSVLSNCSVLCTRYHSRCHHTYTLVPVHSSHLMNNTTIIDILQIQHNNSSVVRGNARLSSCTLCRCNAALYSAHLKLRISLGS